MKMLRSAVFWASTCALVACSNSSPPPLKVPRALILPNRALVTAGPSHQVRRWNVSGNQAKELSPVKDEATSQILSDHVGMVVYDAMGATLVDGAETYAPIFLKKTEGDAEIVAVYNNQGDVVTLHQNGILQTWQFDQKGNAVQLELPLPGTLFEAGIFSREGNMLVAWEKNASTAYVYDVKKAMLIAELPGHGNGISYAVISQSTKNLGFSDPAHPSHLQIATASMDGAVRVWRWWYDNRFYLAQTLSGHTKGATYVDVSEIAKEIVTADAVGTLRIWEDASDLPMLGRLKQAIFGHTDQVDSVLFSSDGSEVISASRDGTARRWGKKTEFVKKIVLPPGCRLDTPLDTPSSCPRMNGGAMNEKGTVMATTSQLVSNNIQLWDVNRVRLGQPGAIAKQFGDVGLVTDLAMSKSGAWLVTLSDVGVPWLWDIRDIRNPQKTASLSHPPGIFRRVAFSPDEKKIVGLQGPYVQLWDISDPAQAQWLVDWKAHDGATNAVVFSADGKYLLTAGEDLFAKIWDLSNPAQPLLVGSMAAQGNALTAVAFSPDGLFAVVGDAKGTLMLWNTQQIQNPTLVSSWRGHLRKSDPAYAIPVLDIVFSPSGNLFATDAREGPVRLWDLQRKVVYAELDLANNPASSSGKMVFSFDGKTLMIYGSYLVGLWDLPSAQELLNIPLQSP